MAFQQSDIDALKAAMATGTMRARYADGREVQFRSLAEMRETLRMMQAEVDAAASGGGGSRSFVAGF
jgi:hypothetical protein